MTETFSKCNFVNTEINHDLNPPIKESLSNKLDFKKIVALNLDKGGNGCDKYTIGENILNDNNIVKKITGRDIAYWSTITEKVDTTFTSLIKTTSDSKINSSKSTAKIMRISKPTYEKNLLQLFQQTTSGASDNLFFIIDTGDDLIDKLKKTKPTKNTNLHVIHSMVTIADSAPKTKPDSNKYTTIPIKGSKIVSHSWYYNVPFNIKANNTLFMSNYYITNNCDVQWKIKQKWNLGGPSGTSTYSTTDAHMDNNRTAIKNLLNPLLNKKSLTDKEKITMNINFQKKRSGDYLQILAAKMMPDILAKGSVSHFTHVRGSSSSPKIIGLGNLAYYYPRTYFVTGDWPAMSYAIYNKVNCIMIVRNKDPKLSFILRIKFN